jgi:hypothetical protein
LKDAYAQLDWEFKPTWTKLSPVERRYLLAVAEAGPHDATTEQVARLLSRTTSQLSSTRDRLINVHQVLEAPALGVIRLRQAHFGQWAWHRGEGPVIAPSMSELIDASSPPGVGLVGQPPPGDPRPGPYGHGPEAEPES